MAEVDYVLNLGNKIIPIEVKSGKTGSLKSMHYFLNNISDKTNKDKNFGIRYSLHELTFEKNILTIPLYMISETERLVKTVL